MSEPSFSINFTARMLAAEQCRVGHALVFDSSAGFWRVATAAVRADLGKRAEAVALTAYGGSRVGKVSYQATGVLAAEISGLGAGAEAWVRVGADGRLERCTPAPGDDLVGKCSVDGRVHLDMGVWDESNTYGGGGAIAPGLRGQVYETFDAGVGPVGRWGSRDGLVGSFNGTGVLLYWYTVDDDDNPIRTLHWTGSETLELRGLSDGTPGRRVTIVNSTSDRTMTVVHLGEFAPVDGAIVTPTGADLLVQPGATVEFLYDGSTSRWRVVGGTAFGGGATPGGSDGAVQVNHSGVLEGIDPGADGEVLVSTGASWDKRRLSVDDLTPAFTATLSGAQTVETGATVVTPAFTASYTGGSPTSATLTDNAGTASKNVTSTPTAFSSSGTFTKTTNGASVTFTLTAIKGGVTKTSSVAITWQPRVYYAATAPGTFNEAFIKALSGSALAASRARTFTVTAGSTQKIYYAIPTAYGTPVFTVGGFEGGFVKAASAVNVTVNGVTQAYDLWESTNAGLGSTTVVVS